MYLFLPNISLTYAVTEIFVFCFVSFPSTPLPKNTYLTGTQFFMEHSLGREILQKYCTPNWYINYSLSIIERFSFLYLCSHHIHIQNVFALSLLDADKIYPSWLSSKYIHLVYDYVHPFYNFTCMLLTFLFIYGFSHNHMANSLKRLSIK